MLSPSQGSFWLFRLLRLQFLNSPVELVLICLRKPLKGAHFFLPPMPRALWMHLKCAPSIMQVQRAAQADDGIHDVFTADVPLIPGFPHDEQRRKGPLNRKLDWMRLAMTSFSLPEGWRDYPSTGALLTRNGSSAYCLQQVKGQGMGRFCLTRRDDERNLR